MEPKKNETRTSISNTSIQSCTKHTLKINVHIRVARCTKLPLCMGSREGLESTRVFYMQFYLAFLQETIS